MPNLQFLASQVGSRVSGRQDGLGSDPAAQARLVMEYPDIQSHAMVSDQSSVNEELVTQEVNGGVNATVSRQP